MLSPTPIKYGQNGVKTDLIIIAGDFNLPSIMWSDTGASVTPSPAYGRELNSLFLEIIDDYGLEQLVYQPPR